MTSILLVEDDPILGRGLKINLELEGYKMDWAHDLRSAEELNRKKPFDLIILDLNLPDGRGTEFLQKLRKAGLKIPVIILTAKTDEDSVVNGLQAGANDYVRKPFGNKELLARIRTALREPRQREEQIQFEELSVHFDRRKALHGNQEIELNRREFDILGHLLRHVEAVVTRESLIAALGGDGDIFDRTIDSHVSHLRTRLRDAGADSIQISSVYGVGYRLEKR